MHRDPSLICNIHKHTHRHTQTHKTINKNKEIVSMTKDIVTLLPPLEKRRMHHGDCFEGEHRGFKYDVLFLK